MMGQTAHQDTVRTYTRRSRKRRKVLTTGESSQGEIHHVPTALFNPLNAPQLEGEHLCSTQEDLLPTQILTDVRMQQEHHNTELFNNSQTLLPPTYLGPTNVTAERFGLESLDPLFPAVAQIENLPEASQLPQIPFEFSFKRAIAPSYVPLWSQFCTEHHGTQDGF